MANAVATEAVRITLGPATIDGDLNVPERATGFVVFAHGSGSSRFSRRNRAVANRLEHAGFATLLLDLLTRDEEVEDERTTAYRFNIRLLGERVVAAADWLQSRSNQRRLPVALFGASTGAAAALIAAAERPKIVGAVISRGGRPDLAENTLPQVTAPTLLIVGSDDTPVIEMNREAMRRMRAPVQLEIIPGATHLFEEPGALEQVASLATDFCRRHLKREMT
jgi:putative phosphoribosyl transferase